MKKPRRLSWMASVPFFAAALFLAVRAESDPAPASATPSAAAASATPSASADSAAPNASTTPSASGSAAAAAPEPPLLKGADIPGEASDRPKEKEWETGKRVRPLRDGSATVWRPKTKPCTLTLVREWLRIRCADRAGALLVTGDKADVTIGAFGDVLTDKGGLVTIVTRVKRNDAKIFTLLGLRGLGTDGDYGGFTFDSEEPISVAWREGREDPVVLIGSP